MTKNESPQKVAIREMMRSYLKDNAISFKDGTYVKVVPHDMMSVLLEGVLDEELVEELGYSKYVTKSKIPTTAEMVALKRPYTPAMAIWR